MAVALTCATDSLKDERQLLIRVFEDVDTRPVDLSYEGFC